MAAPAAKAVGRDIGLGIKAPATSCQDRHCPFHGHLPVRGSVFDGTVEKAHMIHTVVVKRELVRKEPKYERLLRVTRKYSVHSPPCVGAKVGDHVRVAETRPISKTVSFVVVEVTHRAVGEAPLTLPTAKPEEIPIELAPRPIREKKQRVAAQEKKKAEGAPPAKSRRST